METEKETETENLKKNIDKNSVHNKDTDYRTHDVNTDVSVPPTSYVNEIHTNTRNNLIPIIASGKQITKTSFQDKKRRNKYTFYI